MQGKIHPNLIRILTVIFLTLAFLTMPGYANQPTLTIDWIEGNSNVMTIHYTTSDPQGKRLATTNWSYSLNTGKTWTPIDAATIGNNAPKLPGSSTISWNTTTGNNNLAGKYYPSVLFRMQVYDPDDDMGMWQPVAPMPIARDALAAAVMNGEVYALGGSSKDGSALGTVDVYNPVTDTWRRLSSIHPRAGLAAAVVNGEVYAIGGVASIWAGPPIATLQSYLPRLGWRWAAEMPTKRYGLAAVAVEGKIYAIGGETSFWDNPLSTVEAYDPSTNRWQTMADMPTPRSFHAAAVVDGKIYVIGGAGGKQRGPSLSTVEVYDPSTNRWQKRADMPTGRISLAAVALEGKIYAIGGWKGVGTVTHYSAVEVYDPVTDTWRTAAEMTTPRYHLAAATVDGKIYALGGDKGGTVEVFTPQRHSEIAMSESFVLANALPSDPTVAAKVSVTIDPNLMVADGNRTATITVTVLNFQDKPVTDETVSFTATLGTITPTAKHRGDGVYVGTFTAGETPGTAIIRVRTKNGISEGTSIKLVSPQPSATQSTIIATSPILGDGLAASQITVVIRNDQGFPISGRKIKLSVTGSGNIVSEPALTDAQGQTTITLQSTQAETKKMTATVEGVKLAQSVEVVFFWEPPKAIVVLGGEGKNHPDWLTFNPLAQDVYQTLKTRGFKSEDIYFLSPAKEGEVDTTTSKPELKSAITQWAVSQHVGEHTPLFIYLLSHHIDEQFLLEPQGNPDPHLQPEELATWLKALEEEVGRVKMTLFIEGCYSGRFIPHLSAPAKNRVIIASTSADKQAFITKASSFSKRFFEALQHDFSMKIAFGFAREAIQPFSNQVPQLDANGDGKPNLPEDSQKVEQLTLGELKANDLPEILKVSHEPQNPKQGEAIRFLAEVSGSSIKDVSGTLIPPGYDRSRVFKRWAELEEGLISFKFAPKQQQKFEAELPELAEAGNYTLLMTAESAAGDAIPLQLTFTAEQSKSVDSKGRALTLWGNVKKTTVFQNYPNPFNPETWIPYALANPACVTLQIHSLSGELIRELSIGNRPPGFYLTQDQALFWDGRNQAGEPVASGIYFYTLTAGDFKQTRRLLLAK